MRRAGVFAAVTLPAAIVLGGLGASAFNPDSGSVLHNEALWRIFGIMCEGGALLLGIAIIVFALLATLRAMLSVTRSIHRSHGRP